MTSEELKVKYEPRILALLTRHAEEIRAAGFKVGGIADLSGDRYEWGFIVTEDGDVDYPDDGDVDVTFSIDESTEYGEDVDGKPGVTFSVRVVEYGGRIIGGLSPYNYTSDVWVDMEDEEAVDERFSLLEEAGGLVELIEEDFARR